MRRYIPASLKLQFRLLKRRWSDYRNGVNRTFATSRGTVAAFSEIAVTQPVRKSHLFENKVHNLAFAGAVISSTIVQPGELFSFWRIIGNPTVKRGYKTGRNIVNGTLQEAVGGGLCQLSGIIYHTALTAGLPVIERYNHTVDIYQEADRFTPLGADATVVYGYKDLRIRNTLSAPVQFEIIVSEEAIQCRLKSEALVTPRVFEFRRQPEANSIVVETIDQADQAIIARSVYRKH